MTESKAPTGSRSRKARGMKAQSLVAEFLRPLFPWVATVGGASQGRDLLNTPGFAVEVKARREFVPLAWLRQAQGYAGGDEIPLVIWQPDGTGPANIDRFGVMLTLGDFKRLLDQRGGSDARG